MTTTPDKIRQLCEAALASPELTITERRMASTGVPFQPVGEAPAVQGRNAASQRVIYVEPAHVAILDDLDEPMMERQDQAAAHMEDRVMAEMLDAREVERSARPRKLRLLVNLFLLSVATGPALLIFPGLVL